MTTKASKQEAQKIGQATYLILRKFTGKEPLEKLLQRLILEKQ